MTKRYYEKKIGQRHKIIYSVMLEGNMLDVIHRSQRARVCEYKEDGIAITTPYVISDNGEIHISYDGERYLNIAGRKISVDTDILIPATSKAAQSPVVNDGVCIMRSPDTEISNDIDIVIIPNGFELRNDPRKLISIVTNARKRAGSNALIYISGISEPSMLALLAYMGADMFDDVLPKAYGLSGIRCVPEGHIADDDAVLKNTQEMERENDLVHQFIKAGRLRELVDQRAASSPFGVAVLRILDGTEYHYIEESSSVVGDRFSCNTTQSLMRPEVKRFRNKIMNDYRKPSHKKVLVLLPCSAKKPYHTSKSHKLFASAIHTGDHDIYVHEVIVTSPLGAVPRELDVFFPANAYDIPVTGEWKCQEREFIRELVRHIYSMGYDSVISHLGKDTELISDMFDVVDTCVGDPTSPASLKNLDDAVRKACSEYPRETYSLERIETMRSILSFQFGKDASDAIMDGAHVTGKFPYWKIFSGKEQIGMLTPERQMVSFTAEGAEILFRNGINVVRMTDFEMKGNLFAIGVIDADDRIRIGDEVVITMNGIVNAVGVAQMSGREMKELKRGIAVKVRHKRR